jgi:hypothetical protein
MKLKLLNENFSNKRVSMRILALPWLSMLLGSGCNAQVQMQIQIEKANRELFNRLYVNTPSGQVPTFPHDLIYALVAKRWITARPMNSIQYWRYSDQEVKNFTHTSANGKVPVIGELFGFGFYLPDFRPYSSTEYKDEYAYDHVFVFVQAVSPEQLLSNPAGYGVAEELAKNMGFSDMTAKPHESGFNLSQVGQNYAAGGGGVYCGLFDSKSGVKAVLEFTGLSESTKGRPVFSRLEVTYYTPQFGGAQVWIRMNAFHLSRVRDVDREVWKRINQYIVKVI